MKKRKVKHYQSGDLVDSFSEYQGFGQMGPRTIQEDINAAAGDNEIRQKRRPPGLVSPYNPSDKDLAEPGTAGFSRAPVKTTVASPKPPVVTKEQMKKAGYDNLRDYLNAQQGLRRRGTPAKTKELSYQYDSKKFVPQNRREALAEKAREARISPSIMKADRFGMEPDAYILKRKLKEAGYKKGGKVSSASKRADGIASKGKTQGRMI